MQHFCVAYRLLNPGHADARSGRFGGGDDVDGACGVNRCRRWCQADRARRALGRGHARARRHRVARQAARRGRRSRHAVYTPRTIDVARAIDVVVFMEGIGSFDDGAMKTRHVASFARMRGNFVYVAPDAPSSTLGTRDSKNEYWKAGCVERACAGGHAAPGDFVVFLDETRTKIASTLGVERASTRSSRVADRVLARWQGSAARRRAARRGQVRGRRHAREARRCGVRGWQLSRRRARHHVGDPRETSGRRRGSRSSSARASSR